MELSRKFRPFSRKTSVISAFFEDITVIWASVRVNFLSFENFLDVSFHYRK